MRRQRRMLSCDKNKIEMSADVTKEGKADRQLTDHLIFEPLGFEPAQEKWFKSSHPYIQASVA